MEVDSVSGTLAGENGSGLGRTFNGNSCAQCHAQPAIGGSSPGLKSPQNPIPNPQVALATLDCATNTVPPFITADGPVREARFVVTVRTRFFLHDGRTPDLLQAIRAHEGRESEANGVVGRFKSLRSSQVQDLLNFLRSL
jgi:CxxC motif-containing protein (DUF1111 family)